MGTNRSRQSLFGAFGALSLTLIHHHYMSINSELYIHTSTVHLGMQGLVSLLCAQRYATYKSMLDHIHTCESSAVQGARPSVSDCQQPPETPSQTPACAPDATSFVCLGENGAATQVKSDSKAAVTHLRAMNRLVCIPVHASYRYKR
jgi:hypothetical protein